MVEGVIRSASETISQGGIKGRSENSWTGGHEIFAFPSHCWQELLQRAPTWGIHSLRWLQPATLAAQMCDEGLPHVPCKHSGTCHSQQGGLTMDLHCSLDGAGGGLQACLIQRSVPSFTPIWSWTEDKGGVGQQSWKNIPPSTEVNMALYIIWNYRLFGRCTKHWLVFPYQFLFNCSAKSDRWYLNWFFKNINTRGLFILWLMLNVYVLKGLWV